jgi:hypothetical protein
MKLILDSDIKVRCPQCLSYLSMGQATASKPCTSCGATVNKNEALSLVTTRHSRHSNLTPLRVGMQARFQERDYTLTGHLVLSMREEGEKYYWHEFVLVSADGDMVFLEYDEGKWKWTKPFIPRNPVGPQEALMLRKGSPLTLDEHSVLVTQKSTATVEIVEGQFSYPVKQGDSTEYMDAGSGRRLYSVEWTNNEIEFFRGETIAVRRVLALFGLQRATSALDRAEAKAHWQSVLATVCLVCSLLATAMWYYAPGNVRVVGSGSYSLTGVRPEGVRFGPVALDPSRKVHHLMVSASLVQASAWVSAVLETAEGDELLATQGDLWDERGYDGEHWHEWELQADSYFVVQHRGPYYVRLNAEPETTTSGSASYGMASFQLSDGAIYPRWLGFYALCGFFAAVMLYMIAHSIRTQMASGSVR